MTTKTLVYTIEDINNWLAKIEATIERTNELKVFEILVKNTPEHLIQRALQYDEIAISDLRDHWGRLFELMNEAHKTAMGK